MTARTTIGRRALCAAPAALLLPAVGVAAAGAHPDQPLLDACTEFDVLARRIEDCYSRGATPIHDDEERERFLTPYWDRQEALIGQLCALRATTPAGCRARAVTLLHWDPFLTRPAEDPRETCQLKRQVAALLRDLVEVGGAA
jgi:hypothetical protein